MKSIHTRVLLDTGPIVATLDASDQWHSACAEVVAEYAGRCVTTEAVITEACHLIGRGKARGALVLDFLLDAEVAVVALDREALRHASRLMDRYADIPMDFADASLVTVAEALGLDEVITTDRRGFHSYRTAGTTRFRVHPR